MQLYIHRMQKVPLTHFFNPLGSRKKLCVLRNSQVSFQDQSDFYISTSSNLMSYMYIFNHYVMPVEAIT